MGSIKNAFKFIFSPTASRTTGILVILIIAAAVPLTVFVSQKQQELRQRAAGLTYDQCVTNLISTTCADPENPDPACIQDASKNTICQALLNQTPAPTTMISAPTITSAPTSSPPLTTTVIPNKSCSSYSQGDPGYMYTCSNQNLSPSCENRSSVPGFDASACTNAVCWRCPLGFVVPTSTPIPTPTAVPTAPTTIPTPKPCSGAGYWCYGPADASNALASGCKLAPTNFDCKLSDGSNGPTWGTCYSGCPVSQTSTSRSYNNTSTGNSQSTGVAPTYSPGPTSIPAGYITLYFNVVLPGMSPTMTTAPITATLYQGSSPIGPFSNISLTRQTNSDIFTGDSGTKIRISDITVGQDYYVEVKAQSYEKQIITGGEQKNPQGLRTVFNNSTLPSVKLRPGDIDGNGTIDGADYGILVACFGNKNILTGATGRTDCGNKTNNGQFNPDINKDGKVVGDDINLLWRAVNGTL